MGIPSPGINKHFYPPSRTPQTWDGIAMQSGEFNHRHARGPFESPGLLNGRPVDNTNYLPPQDYYSESVMAAPAPARSPRNFSVFVSSVNARSRPAARRGEIWQGPKLARPADPPAREVGSPLSAQTPMHSPSHLSHATPP